MLRSSVLLALAALMASACTPTCERTCRKLLNCGTLETDRVSVGECEASCERQITHAEGWDDEKEMDKAIDEHRRCLVRSSCDEIEDGVCYDERLFPVGVPETVPDTGP